MFEKYVSSGEIKAGRYHLVLCLGMGAEALLQDKVLQDIVKQMTFSIHADGQLLGQIVTSEWDIGQMPQSPELRLRFHRGFEVFPDANHDYKIVVEIVMRETISYTPLPFELHAFEFRDAYIAPQTLEEHIFFGTEGGPLSFSADASGTTTNTPAKPVKISAFAISETGTHLAVLYFVDDQVYIRTLDLSHGNGVKSETKTSDLVVAVLTVTPEQAECLRIAINRGGTQVAIFQSISNSHLEAEKDEVTLPSKSKVFPFTVFSAPGGQTIRMSLKTGFLQESIVDTQLCTFVGFGKFATTPDGKELFVSCDGLSVVIHRTKYYWSRLYIIALQPATPTSFLTVQGPIVTFKDLRMAKALIESANGTYFAWLGNPTAISIWSMEVGHMVSFIADSRLPITAAGASVGTSGTRLPIRVWSPNTSLLRIASHGRHMAIVSNSQICKYLLPSGTLVGITDVSSGLKEGSTIIDIWWIEGRLLIAYHEERALATFLVTVDVERQHWRDRRIIPLNSMEHSLEVRDRVYTVHGSTVDISSMNDLIEAPLSLHGCKNNCKCDVANEAAKDTSLLQEYALENGDRFELKTDESSDAINLLLLPFEGSQPMQWNFIARGWRQLIEPDVTLLPAFILEGTSRFVIVGAGYVQVWQLPTPGLESCRLVVMATAPASTKKDDRAHSASHPTVGQHIQHLTVCQHMRYLTVQFGEDEKHTIDMSRDNHDHLVDSKQLKVWPTLVQLYTVKDGNSTYQQALLQYTVQAFKQCPTWDYSKNVFLLQLCEGWEVEGFEEFLQDLVQHPDFLWIPADPASRYKDNAIAFGITTSWDHPHRDVQFHLTLIKHCIRNATRGGDTFFLRPIFDCLPLIIDEHFGLEVMRQMAFIPVPESSRTFVIENSIISRSKSISWWPGADFQIKVYNDDNPILQLDCVKELDPQIKYFKKRLFVAPIDMLYQIRAYNIVESSVWRFFQTKDKTALGLVSGAEYDRISRKRMSVWIPSFSLQMLDNPTLEVLVQFIWDTRGSRVWLSVTIAQFLLSYALVIVQTTSLSSVIIYLLAMQGAISLVAVELLIYIISLRTVTELQPTRRRWGRSVPSLGVFRRWYYWTLTRVGFAVVLVGLTTNNIAAIALTHLAFHLVFVLKFQVFQKFCKFFDFIFRLAADIGLFLSLFAFGVVAFAQVFWLVIHGCSEVVCEESTSQYPKNFVKAIFATYFFLGGRYDPVSKEMDSDLSIFHAVMALYYFFTAIVLLNVLIGLVNVTLVQSIESSESTWRLTWLESRRAYTKVARVWPDKAGQKEVAIEREVYFTATDDDVREFHQKYMEKSEGFLRDRGVKEKASDSEIIVLKDRQIEGLEREVAHMSGQVVALQSTIATLAAAGLKTHHGSIEE